MAKEKGLFSRFFQRDSYMDGLKNIDEDLKKAVEGLEKLKKDCVEKHKLVLAFVFNYDHKGGKVKELKEEVKAIKERIKKDKRIGHRVEVYCGKIIAIIGSDTARVIQSIAKRTERSRRRGT